VAAYATSLVLCRLVVIGWCADRFNLKRESWCPDYTSHADNVATKCKQLLAEMKVTLRHFRSSMVGLNSVVESSRRESQPQEKIVAQLIGKVSLPK